MEQLKQIASNPALLEAIKQHFLKRFDYSNRPVNTNFEELGMWVTVQDEGRCAVLEAIKEIEALRTVKVEEQVNPGV